MIPISKYWKTLDDDRFGEIIEPYCGALCGLKKWRLDNICNDEKPDYVEPEQYWES